MMKAGFVAKQHGR